MTMRFTADEAELALTLVRRMREGGGNTFWNQVLDRTEKKIRREYNLEPSPQERYDAAMDAKVAEILNSEPFVSQRRQREADMALFEKATRYMDHVAHQYWELKGFDKLGVKEPPVGCASCRGDYEAWLATPVRDYGISRPKTSLETNMDLLATTHERFMRELKEPRPRRSMSSRGAGYVEEEPQP